MAGPGAEEFGVSSSLLPSISRSSQSGVDTDSNKQALERALQAAEEYLAGIAERFSPGRAKAKAISGDNPVAAIMDFVRSQQIDLIAMSTHGRSGLGRWVYGSTADKLLHSTSIPLLLVRPGDHSRLPREARPIDTLVIPLDGSDLAESALAYGEELAGTMALKLSLIRVVSTAGLTYPGTSGYAYNPKMFSDLENAAAVYLKQKQTELEQKGFKVEHTVRSGYPADHIIDFAEANEGSIILMSTHGRTGIGRWVMGSVADRILRASSSPVLLIRSQKKSD